MQIIKRNGTKQDFNSEKIVEAIMKAMDETDKGVDFPLAFEVASDIESYYEANPEYPLVEDVQDDIERLLSEYGRFDVSKRYIIYRQERTDARNKEWVLDELQSDIYENKYRFEGESFPEFLDRVSGGNTDVRKLIQNKDFSFAGRILAGRGINRNVTLSNCYVLPQPEDNLESIFDTAKFMARTYSYGGGVGLDMSLLRPNGSPVNNSALTTSGAVSFMELYSTTTKLIGQKGRRGALMISMDVDHPDIVEFIHSKRDLDQVTSANISVRFNDNFFNKIDDDKNQNILDEMAISNWQSGEPGSLYWDRVEKWHLLSHHPKYKMTSTNPCGEQPLPDFGNCLLGSLNLGNFVINPYTSKARIDWERLVSAVRTAIVGLNEVLDESIPLHPLEQQRETAKGFRQIGLGIMGLADMFIQLGIEYGSGASLDMSYLLGETIRDSAVMKSVELAKEDGAYPNFDIDTIYKSEYFKSLKEEIQDEILEHGMRNSHVLSIAPTGSISTMWGVSGGIEPIFANSYTRTTKSIGDGDMDYKVYNPTIRNLMNHIGTVSEDDLPNFAITSHDIKPIDRIKLQGQWQHYIDSAISSTINLNEDATVEDIKEIYIKSWDYGLKGVTVFRNNSWRKGILNTDDEEIEEEESIDLGDCDT